MSTVKNIVQKALTIGVAVVTVLASFSGLVAPLAAQAIDASCPAGVVAGAQVKVGNKPAVYILDNAMHYRYFESGDLYKSWRPDNTYAGIVVISQACFDSLTQPAMPPFHVFWRPGSYVVKYLGADQLYSVESNGVLAPLTASAATTLYGSNYKVMTIGLSEWPYYSKTGASLDGTKVAPGMLVSNGGKTWYVADSNTIRQVTDAGMTGNWFKSAFVHPVADSLVAGFTQGTQIAGSEAALTDRLQQGGVVSTPGTVTGGNLMVSLAADNPAAGTLASNTAFNPVLKFNLTAGSQGASVTGITFTKSGFMANTGISGVDIIDGQGVRHGNVISSVSTDNTVTVLFTSNPIVVAAGATQSVTVRVNLASTATSGTLSVSVLNANAFTSNGTVGGTFPVMGNVFQIQNGANAIANVILDEQPVNVAGAQLNVDPTNEQDVAKFSLQESSSKEDVKVMSWTLYNNGTASDSDLQDVQLVAQDGTVLATAQQISKTVAFNLTATPYVLGKGLTKNFTVRAKIINGPARTTQFTVYNNYDVVVAGVSTGANVLPSAGSNDTSFPVGDSTATYNKVTVGTGSLSFNKDVTSPTNSVAPGASNVVLAKFYAKPVGEDMELRNIGLVLASSSQVLGGTYTIKVNGTSVYSGSTGAQNVSATIGSPTTITLSSYAVLPANQNSYITVESSILSGAANSATTTVQLNLNLVKRLITNDLYTPTTNLTSGNTLTVQAGALKVNNLATPVAQSVVAGTTNLELANIELNAGSVSSGEDVKVTSLVVSQVTSGAVTSTGNFAMYQKNNDGTLTQLTTNASTATGAASTTFTFTNPVTIPKAGAVVLVLKGDVLFNDSATHTWMVAPSNVTAVGKDTGNSLTYPTNITGSGAGQSMTITASGSLTLSLVSGNNATPANDQVVTAGATAVPVFAIKLTAQNEPVKITTLRLTASGTLNSVNDISNLQLYKDADVSPFASANQMSAGAGTTSTVVSWTAPDNLLPSVITPGTPVTIYVKANIGVTNQAVLGDSFKFKINSSSLDVVARGVSSGATVVPTGSVASSGNSYIVPFVVSIVGDAPTAGTSANQAILAGTQIGRFKITNNGSSKVTINGIKFTNSGSQSGNTTTYSLKYSDQNSSNYTANTASSTMTNSVDFSNLSTGGTAFTIDGGAYRYVTVSIAAIGGSITGDSYSLSVASIGDIQLVAAEADLGYDSNNSGTISGNSNTFYADGKPSLGTLVKQ